MTYPDEAFEKILLANLQRVIDFLKFAEAKNGALLTFSSAWTLAIVGILSSDNQLSACVATALNVALPFVIGAGGFAMVSFFPRVDLPSFLGGTRAGPHPKNLLYFGDISSMTASEFEQSIRGRYLPQEERTTTDEYIRDLTVQIFINSQITSRKLRLFGLGLWLVAISAIVVVVSLTMWTVGIIQST